jgi:hypothetical protein
LKRLKSVRSVCLNRKSEGFHYKGKGFHV